MAIDNNSLCYLFDSIFQVENVAGRPVVGGHIEVFIAGTDQKYITWQNFDGTKNPFKIPLNNDGRAVVLVEPHYTYDIYIYDSFNNMICSRLNVKPAIGGDVTVYGLTEVWHDGTMSGEGTPQSPLSVVSAGKVYTGIEPIVVNNIENKISAQHIPLGVQDPLYFVEDSETACIIGFSGETIPEGVMSESALGFENNKITGYNGSAFSAGNEYEAGSYVDIDNNTISVTGLQPEGDYAYNSALSSKLDVTALPQDLVHSGDLTAYYPTSNPSGFITGVDLSDYATNEDLQTVSADITAMIPTALTGDYLTKESADTLYQSIGNYQSALDFGYVGSEISSINGSGIYSQGGTANPQIPVTSTSGISIFESGDKVYFNISADYATHNDVESATSGIPTIGTAEYDGEFETVHTINNLPIWSNYSNWADAADRANEAKWDAKGRVLSALPDSATVSSMISSSITGKADTSALTAYAKNWQLGELEDVVDTKLDSTAFSTVSANFYTTANESGFVTSGELPDPITIGVQEGDTLDTDYDGLKIVKATANGNEHINLHKKSTDQWLIHGNLVPTSPGSNKYLVTDDSGAMHWDNKSALAYDSAFEQSGGYITAYNGSAFKAGDELPSGVMVESGLEYNAVNEISGYNGSAIAQYGAEKQWLQHDDTLVHAANSAQYALGVNLSAVAQLLGVDETVLFETTSGGALSGSFTENLTNFNYIEFFCNRVNTTANSNLAGSLKIAMVGTVVPPEIMLQAGLHITTAEMYDTKEYFNLTNSSFAWAAGCNTQCTATGTNGIKVIGLGFKNFGITKVIGIGRKEV